MKVTYIFKWFWIIVVMAIAVSCGGEKTNPQKQNITQIEGSIVNEEADNNVEDTGSDDTNNSNNAQSGYHKEYVTNILFAHGFLGSVETWEHFNEVTAEYDERDWNIYETNVSKTGSIEERANQLADYINIQDIAPNSMITIGHSMGGLDLRYIVSKGNQNQSNSNKFYKAAKKIHKIYTIATPHKGSDVASLVPDDDGAVHDLSVEHMEEFNKENPYSGFNIDGRSIPMLAFRFKCKKLNDALSEDSDSVVKVKRQILDGAPYTKDIFSGRHTTDNIGLCIDSSEAEVLQTIIIKGVLENKQYEQK